MKQPVRWVVTASLIGLVLGAAAGWYVASHGGCILESADPNATCYELFGRYVTSTTWHVFWFGVRGLAIGLAVGLLVAGIGWALHAGRDDPRKEPSEASAR